MVIFCCFQSFFCAGVLFPGSQFDFVFVVFCFLAEKSFAGSRPFHKINIDDKFLRMQMGMLLLSGVVAIYKLGCTSNNLESERATVLKLVSYPCSRMQGIAPRMFPHVLRRTQFACPKHSHPARSLSCHVPHLSATVRQEATRPVAICWKIF